MTTTPIPPTPPSIWKQQPWGVQTMVVIALIGAAMAGINLILWTINSILTGSWAYSDALDDLGPIAFGWAFAGWVYWHGYAVQLEQRSTARIPRKY